MLLPSFRLATEDGKHDRIWRTENFESFYLLSHHFILNFICIFHCTKVYKRRNNLTVASVLIISGVLMSTALGEHLTGHGDTGVVIAGVLQPAPTLDPLLPDKWYDYPSRQCGQAQTRNDPHLVIWLCFWSFERTHLLYAIFSIWPIIFESIL